MEEAELKRLLYVALTRAESRLIISGVEKTGGKQKYQAMMSLVLEALRSAGVSDLYSETQIPDVPSATLAQVRRDPGRREANAVEAAYEAAHTIERKARRLDFTVTELARSAEAEGDAARAGDAAPADRAAPAGDAAELPALAIDQLLEAKSAEAAFGTLCHRLAEIALSSEGGFRLPASSDLSAREEIKRLLRPLGGQDALVEAEKLVTLAIERRLADLADGREIRAELGFTLGVELGSAVANVRGQIDLVLIGKEDVLLIDFKTDRIREPDRHVLQLTAYHQAAAELFGLPVRVGLLYLRDAGLVWVEPDYDRLRDALA
jgi:ATP-dependent exoDNAse (exonuclease V) beta subunit